MREGRVREGESGRMGEWERVMLGLDLEIKNLVEYDITKPLAYALMAFLRF